jgi:thymidylate kinase
MSKREARRGTTEPAEDGREPLIRQVADGVRIENEGLIAKIASLRPEWKRYLKLTVAVTAAEMMKRRRGRADAEAEARADAEAKVFSDYKDLDPRETVIPVGFDIVEAKRKGEEIVLESTYTETFDEIRGYLQSLMD